MSIRDRLKEHGKEEQLQKITIIHVSAERRRIVLSKIIKNIQRRLLTLYRKLLCHICDIDISFYNIVDHVIYRFFVFFFFENPENRTEALAEAREEGRTEASL